MTSAMLNMMMAVVREEQLADPSWILDLDDIDEPPLFTRDEQVEFLYRIPRSERCVTALQVALMLLENVAEVAASRAPDQTFSLCVTLSDFDDFRDGLRSIPTLALSANPRVDTLKPVVPFVPAHSPEGKEVVGWLSKLDPSVLDRFVVAELPAGAAPPELQTVYVGWSESPYGNIRSVGDGMCAIAR